MNGGHPGLLAVLHELLVRIPDVVAGFFGSITAIFADRKISRWEALGVMISGSAAAVFLTPFAAEFLPHFPGVRDATAFAVGVITLAIVSRIIRFIKSGKLPWIGKGGANDV